MSTTSRQDSTAPWRDADSWGYTIVAAPVGCEVVAIIEPRWWYMMLMQVARKFKIKMAVQNKDGCSK
jgi:hypothetical protein